jgi:hypothetical protein
MVQPAARRQRLARIGEIRPTAKWFHRIGREFAALCVSDVDHPISYNQRATALTSAKRIPQSCRALSTSRSDAGWAGDSCESEVTSAPDSAICALDGCTERRRRTRADQLNRERER